MPNKFSKCLFLISALLLWTNQVVAYEINVHNPICNVSLNLSKLDSLLNYYGYGQGREYYLVQTDAEGNVTKSRQIKDWISDGGETEDAGKKGQDDFLTTRAVNHFHDPLEPWDNAFFHNILTTTYSSSYGRQPVSALLWGLQPGNQNFSLNTTGDWSWSKARQSLYESLTAQTQPLRDNHFADTLRAVGQLMHLIQDMSVPAHTRNDAHVFPLTKIPFTDNQLEEPILGPWHYETYTWNWQKNHAENFSEFLANLSPVSPDPTLFTPPSNLDPQYASVAQVSGLFDSDIYTDSSSPPPLDSNSVGLAEYTNANFFSLDTIWEYPHPAKAETDYHTAIRQARDGARDTVLHIYRTSDTQLANPIAAVRYFAEELYAGDPEIKADFLDDEVFHGYSTLLIPRAVGYSAGLLDYFFRGAIEVTLPNGAASMQVTGDSRGYNQVTLKASNASPDGEDLTDGTIQLAVGYTLPLESPFDTYPAPPPVSDYQYLAPVLAATDTIGRGAGAEMVFVLPDDGIPVNAEDVRLQLIYRGQLGQEADGIATGGVTLQLSDPIEVSLPDRGYYALAPGENATEFQQLTVRAENIVPGNLAMNGGQVALAVKYREAADGAFVDDENMNLVNLEYGSFLFDASGTVSELERNQPVELSFDLSNNPIPMNAVDLVMEVRFTDAHGNTYTGLVDISEASPIDIFNTGDVVCINQEWYTAGSPEAIAQVDADGDGIAEGWLNSEHDVYPHNFDKIYWLFSSPAAPAIATAEKNDFFLEKSTTPREHLRLGYALTDYTNYHFSRNVYELVHVSADDNWPSYHSFGFWWKEIFSGQGFKNQVAFSTDSDCLPGSTLPKCYPRRISWLYSLRGITTWSPFFLVNPEVGSPPPCDYFALPE